MVSKNFENGDLVWAKMRGYRPWPGRIMKPPPDAKSKPKKDHHYVFFFGSNNYAWIADDCIELHTEKHILKHGKNKSGVFGTAVETIIEFSKRNLESGKPKGGSEKHSNENTYKAKDPETIKQEPGTDIAVASGSQSKKKSSLTNNIPKTIKKKIDIKKEEPSPDKSPSLKKKRTRKRAHSPDQNEAESCSATVKSENESVQSEEPILFTLDDLYIPTGPLRTIHQSPPPPRRYFERPETPPNDLMFLSDFQRKKKIVPTKMRIGVLGLGRIWHGIVKNLYHSHHSLIIWNQNPEQNQCLTEKFEIRTAGTVAEVIQAADVIFCCIDDESACKDNYVSKNGVLKSLDRATGARRDFVEMTPGLDPKVSQAVGGDIRLKGGRYLEAPICGSRDEANEGTLLVVAAGDKSLYDDCKSCFDAISKKNMFISAEIGTGIKLNIVHNMLIGTVYAALAESLALVDEVGLKGEHFLDILGSGSLNSVEILEKLRAMIGNSYSTDLALKHVQQDLNLGLALGHEISQRTTIFATANEVYKKCKAMKYAEHDVSAVYEGAKP